MPTRLKSLIRSITLAACMLFGGTAWASCTGSSPTWATTADYASVSSCVSGATAGDTITVTGNATWASSLAITKGINLIGSGSSPAITSSYTGAWLISYTPSDYSQNWPLRISGFAFDFAGKCGGIILNYSGSNWTIQTKIRIDHNVFQNANSQVLLNNGFRGVFDNNTITGVAYPFRFASGADATWWNNWEGVVFGKQNNNFYVEDNIISSSAILSDCQYGNRYVFRYNTITVSGTSYPFLDMHGNQGPGLMYACFGGEIYGNQINGIEGQILDQRGGKTVVFYNNAKNLTLGIKVREEVGDSFNPTTNTQPQHVNDSYYWNNRNGLSGSLESSYVASDDCDSSVSTDTAPCPTAADPYTVAINVTHFDDSTGGVSSGTLANLPATCTVGQGYWATDQSCSDLTGLVGDINTYPTRQTITGTLYKCTGTNVWTAFFKPYTYPHPLRSGLGTPSGLHLGP